MKVIKLSVVLALAAAVILAFVLLPKRLALPEGESYIFFVGDSSKNCREVKADGNAALVRLELNDVCGECTQFSSLDVDKFLSDVDGEIIFKEEIDGSVNYYCSAALPYSVSLYGKEINLHICVRDGGVKVATPIIFGGY